MSPILDRDTYSKTSSKIHVIKCMESQAENNNLEKCLKDFFLLIKISTTIGRLESLEDPVKMMLR